MVASKEHFIDLHIHSRFSRATSPLLEPRNLSFWAKRKGLSLLGTGDLTHPGWLSQLAENLTERDDGFYSLNDEPNGPRFVPTGEVSCIYKQDGRTRKIHLVIISPNLELAQKFSQSLGRLGNINSDGRPIVGLTARQILELALSCHEDFIVVPAHIWTPWFSLFGSKSGFDQLEECFGDLSGHITALETGLSSDPEMNRLISALDSYALISSSDAHSPDKLGREASILKGDLSWPNLQAALKGGPSLGGTLEFFPEEGKYHLDGHITCGPALTPQESKKLNGLCPVCGKPLTIGVLSRVMELADRETPQNKNLPDHHLIPLAELLGQCLKVGPKSKKVLEAYERLLNIFDNEINILLKAQLDEIAQEGGLLLERAIGNMRRGEVSAKGGFDGQYGVISSLSSKDFAELSKQSLLFQMPTAAPTKKKEQKKLTVETPLKKKLIKSDDSPFLAQEDLILDNLDPDQKEAVASPHQRLLISAGPGSGKTRVLVHRAAWLIREKNIKPEKTLITTFTKKAAEALRPRLLAALPFRADVGQVVIKTLHALALDLLDKPGWQLAPEIFWQKLIKDSAKKAELSPKKWALQLSLLKNQWPQNLLNVPLNCKDAFIFYHKKMQEQKFWDFDDLIIEAQRQTKMPTFEAILIDEFQDLSPSQVAFIEKLKNENKESFICVIGDPDQSIYGFRGAGENFKKLTDFEVSYLAINYRSSKNIVEASNTFLKKALPHKKRPARLAAQTQSGPKITRTIYPQPQSEAHNVAATIASLLGVLNLGAGGTSQKDLKALGDLALSDIAVLYRLKSQGVLVGKALDDLGLAWQMSGEEEITATDHLNFQADKINLLSIHASKGLEFKIVFIIGLEDGLCPYNHNQQLKQETKAISEAELSEEKRLFYVALTRAKERLYLSAVKSRIIFGQKIEARLSPFWQMLPSKLCLDLASKQKIRRKKKMPGLFDL